MKKISIIAIIIVVALAALPIIGNKLIKETLDSKIELLRSQGIELRDSSVDSSYLTTSRHYEFLIGDTNKFLKYLTQYSDKQLPAYTSALLNGTLVGADFKYSNIPFSKAVEIDIYPLSFSAEMIKEFHVSDKNFGDYIENFIAKKGILYHINYNIITQKFDGFIKDIDEKYTMKNGAILDVKIKDAVFNGNGNIIAPTSLQASSNILRLKIINKQEEFSINLDKLSTASTFDSQTTYLTSAKLKTLSFDTKNSKGDKSTIKIADIFTNVSLNTQGKKAEFDTKISFSSLHVDSKELAFQALNMNYNIAAFGIDKDALEELRVLISKSKALGSIDLATKITNSSINLLSKGLKVVIADFSTKNIKIDKLDLDGFVVQSQLLVKEDKDLAKKIKYNPMYIAKNIDFNLNLKISKKIFIKITSVQPMLVLAQSYAKDAGDDLIFDVTLKNNELKVNGKALGI